jgi:hypothetical protein
MKTPPIFSLIILSIALSGCEKVDLEVNVPSCIEKEIKDFQKTSFACDSEAQVLRYDFQDSQVFVFKPGNCGADLPEKIYDSSCNLICSLGGFEGNIYCNGEIFLYIATNRTLVWKNE